MSPCHAAAAGDPSAAEARAALVQWFAAMAKVRTVEADFEQLRKLSRVRNPMRKPGRLWLDKDTGQFRWQVGAPPQLVAVCGRDGSMTVLDVKEKRATVWSREALAQEEWQGSGQGWAMLRAMQSATLTEFDRKFELDGWSKEAVNPFHWSFDWKFKDGRATLVVLKLSFQVHVKDGTMRAFTIHLRDGSTLSTVFGSQRLNQPVAANVFALDTTGCVVERKPLQP